MWEKFFNGLDAKQEVVAAKQEVVDARQEAAEANLLLTFAGNELSARAPRPPCGTIYFI
jgi:hypothetical protein